MRRITLWSIALTAALALPLQAQSRYVGVKACARCHAAEKPEGAVHQWRTSPHAEAYRTLQTHTESQARKCQDLELWIVEIGRGVKYGLPRPATESKECLPCHVTAFGADAKQVEASFDPQDGVQCESCHGPGSAHVEAASARDGGRPAEGLKRYDDERAIEARCRTCHEGTCGDFDFAAMWPRIRHTARGGR